MKTCAQCSAAFEITDADQELYQKIGVPDPKLCADCHMQRILCFRNERKLYKRKCDFTGKPIVSIYDADVTFPVYHPDVWWSDQWDPLEFGRAFDFSRSFFSQMAELQTVVPKISLMSRNCENSEYSNNEEGEKNCYMTFAGGFNEDCYYSRLLLNSKDCMDCLNSSHSELCYECINVYECYHCIAARDLKNCRDIFFSQDLIGCQDCIACVGLRHKKYYILNKKYSQEEYLQKKQQLEQDFHRQREWYLAEFQKLLNTVPYRYAQIINSQDCTGDYILNSKNCVDSFDILECEDCRRIQDGQYCKDCADSFLPYEAELSYNSMGVCLNAYHCISSVYCWNVSEMMYCQHCFYSTDLFGCIGVKNKKYCILNKQYTKEAYEQLVPQIIEHMKTAQEWGEFFPMEMSPFAYNQTVAQDYFPLIKQEVVAKGWRWKDEVEPDFSNVTKKIAAARLPKNIVDVPDDILNWVIICEASGRPFKIQKGELMFYRRMNLPIPHYHHDIRHAKRMASRNPRQLWSRNCEQCGIEVQSTYAPDRSETVYCEECYLQALQ